MTAKRNLTPPGAGDYDNVRVHFGDGTSTLIWVHKDESIAQATVDLCESEGWDVREVTNTTIEGQS